MTKYHEILRLKSLRFSERNIAQSYGISKNTISKVLKKVAETIKILYNCTGIAICIVKYSSLISPFESVNPSLASTHLHKEYVWCKTDSKHSTKYFSILYTSTITETNI